MLLTFALRPPHVTFHGFLNASLKLLRLLVLAFAVEFFNVFLRHLQAFARWTIRHVAGAVSIAMLCPWWAVLRAAAVLGLSTCRTAVAITMNLGIRTALGTLIRPAFGAPLRAADGFAPGGTGRLVFRSVWRTSRILR